MEFLGNCCQLHTIRRRNVSAISIDLFDSPRAFKSPAVASLCLRPHTVCLRSWHEFAHGGCHCLRCLPSRIRDVDSLVNLTNIVPYWLLSWTIPTWFERRRVELSRYIKDKYCWSRNIMVWSELLSLILHRILSLSMCHIINMVCNEDMSTTQWTILVVKSVRAAS